MPTIRELVARSVSENDIKYIRIPHAVLNQDELNIFKFIERFQKQNGVLPDIATMLSNFKNLNTSYFKDFNTRYDEKTLREEVLKERVSDLRRKIASQHFDEGTISYEDFQTEMKALEKISNDIESAIVLASEMDDDLDWLTTGFIETPLREMNRIYSGGLGYGDISLFAGGTGTGKTYFLTFLIMYALITGKRVVVNPSEMSKNGYWQRFVSWSTGIPWSVWLTNLRSKDNSVSAKALKDFKIAHRFLKNEFGNNLIFTTKNFGSVRDFDRAVTEVYDKFGSMDFFVTDTIQDIETSKNVNGTLNDSAVQTSKELRNWVTDSNSEGKRFHMATTAQLIKSAQGSTNVGLGDIGGSKRAQEDATYIMALTNKTESTRRGTPLKVRHGEKTGSFHYTVNWQTMSFVEILQDDQEGETYTLSDVFNIKLS